MKKVTVLFMALIATVAIFTGCATAKRGDTSYHGPSNARAEEVIEPSPGWSVAQEAVRNNPNANVRMRSGSDVFEYNPPGSTPAPGNDLPANGMLKGTFHNGMPDVIDVKIIHSGSVVDSFSVQPGQCKPVPLPPGKYSYTVSNRGTGENVSLPFELMGVRNYTSPCGGGHVDFVLYVVP